jgi:hypothetical protein
MFQKVNKHSDAGNFILTYMHAFHMPNRWYTSQLHVFNSGNEAYVPP